MINGRTWIGAGTASLLLALAALALTATSGCASTDDDDVLAAPGRPSIELETAWRGGSRLRFRPADYEHHLDRQSPQGVIEIDTRQGEAQVFLVENGGFEVFQGTTPLRFATRANGISHVFVLRRPGFVDRRIDVGASYQNPNVRVTVLMERDLSQPEPERTEPHPYDNLNERWNLHGTETRYYTSEAPTPRGDRARSRWPALELAPDGTTSR